MTISTFAADDYINLRKSLRYYNYREKLLSLTTKIQNKVYFDTGGL